MKIDMRNPADIQIGIQSKAFLDGKEIPFCLLSDEEAGVVEFCKKEANGRFVLDGAGNFRVYRQSGHVRIELTPKGHAIAKVEGRTS